MPADERYFYNLKTMHVVFALSAAAMLVAAVLMMWRDHEDEWRQYQTTWDRIEATALTQQIRKATSGDYEARLETLEKQLAEANQQVDPQKTEELQQRIKDLQLKADLVGRQVREQRAVRDVARANFDLGVTQERSEDELADRQSKFEDEQAQVNELELALQKAEIELNAAKEELGEQTAERDRIEAELQALKANVERLEKAEANVNPTGFSKFKRTIMQLPVIDGFNSPHEIKQDWLPNLKIELGMAHSARFDRCRTCHLGIERVQAGNIPAFPMGHPETDDIQQWVKDGTFPNPFATHPNPNLYLTASSPHPLAEFGCTVCHEGQGSATSFTNAAHTPNNPHIEHEWKDEYGFFVNHFWEYPMHPKRFAESTCLKCHHEVTELAVNEQWGATAPKVHRGFQLIEKYGCFGCHEIHGYGGDKRIGPDLRLEPNYFAVALQVLADPAVPDDADSKEAAKAGDTLVEISRLAHQVSEAPWETAEQRAQLRQLILADTRLQNPQLALPTHNLADELKDVDHAGEYRKVGPALRHVASKTFRNWIEYWTEEPKRFRPETRMPQFFKLTNLQDAHAAELQPVEIAGIAEYLVAKSQPLDLLEPAEGYEPDAESGKVLFSRRGCLACHSHKDFPGSHADFGPNLSRVGEKLRPGREGFQWLYTWVRDPHKHDKRSRMPYLYLEPYEQGDRTVDPAADIAAYLLASTRPKGKTEPVVQTDGPHDEQPPAESPEAEEQSFGAMHEMNFKLSIDDELQFSGDALDSLVKLYLSKVLRNPEVEATMDERRYQVEEISQIKGDEIELHRPKGSPKLSDKDWRSMKLRYIGRRTISRYGCYGCHDIPGFEGARPIGTPLQDWGRKDPSKLALEHIEEYLHHHGEPDGSSTVERVKTEMNRVRSDEYEAPVQELDQQIAQVEQKISKTEDAAARAPLQQELKSLQSQRDELIAKRDAGMTAAFFYDSLLHHGRAGFLWQKLRQPRSYDYLKLDTKGYDERLRMPRFPFDEGDIEEIATFVLGLVADPPGERYVYRPDDRAATRIAGEKLLQKYNCVGCHVLELPRITYALENGFALKGHRDELVQWLLENREGLHRQSLAADQFTPLVKALEKSGSNVGEIIQATYDQNAADMRTKLGAWFDEHPLPNGYGDLFRMTSDELAGWIAANRDAIRSGELKPEQYPQDVQLMVRLGANIDEIVQLTYNKNAERMQENVAGWLAEHPEVRLMAPPQNDEFLPGIKRLLQLKPPKDGDAGIGDDYRRQIRFHGLMVAAPDPQETDPDLRFYSFRLFDTMQAGGRVMLPPSTIAPTERFVRQIVPARGGDFAEYLVGLLAADPNHRSKGDRGKAWESAPPTLYLEGKKVQTDWLFRFLKNPDRIRYETVLRMPRFNMSDREARVLASYFAAVDGVEYPYNSIPQREEGYLDAMARLLQSEGKEADDQEYLPTAWQVLVRNELCSGCHAVGGREFKMGADPKQVTHGPDLRNVADRLRPDYLQVWLSKPAWILPYTSMPAPGTKPVPGLFDADPSVQAVALRDALINYHRMMERQVNQPQPAGGQGTAPAAQPANDQKPDANGDKKPAAEGQTSSNNQ